METTYETRHASKSDNSGWQREQLIFGDQILTSNKSMNMKPWREVIVFFLIVASLCGRDAVANDAALPVPIAHWKLDDEGYAARDSVGQHHGVIHGAVTHEGKSGRALLFDRAKGNHVSIPHSSDFEIGTFTVSAWVWLTKEPTFSGILGTRAGGEFNFDMKINTDKVHGDIGDGSRWIDTRINFYKDDVGSNGQGGDLETQRWYLVTFVIDNERKECRLYLDADRKKTIPFQGEPRLMRAGQTMQIGSTGTGEFMDGVIDEVRVWKDALTDEQVKSLSAKTLIATGSAIADEVTRVFLFAGQSNMVGADAHADRIDDFPEFRAAGVPQEDVLYSYILGNGDEVSKGWVPLQPLRSFGPELTFARRVKRQIQSPIAIIKSAVGGTTIAFDWNPDAPDKGQKLYPRTLRLIRESLGELEKRGVRYRLDAVMWHQGENDMLDRNLYKQYADGLTKLVARLREDLLAPQLKWYIAEVSEKGIWGMDHRSNLGILRQQQEQAIEADPLLRWVPTSHLAFEVMESGQPHYHFGTQGQLQMGEAFAAAYLRDIGQPLATVERRFKSELPIAKKAHVRLFVLAGQRNMEGEDSHVSEIREVPGFESLANQQDQILYRYSLGGGVKVSSDWEPLGPVDFLGNFGPELSFGARLRKSIDANEGVAIVKFTHSGAQGPDWFPQGSPEAHRNLYSKLIACIRNSQDDLNRQGFECSLEGIYWNTGENDTFFGPYSQNHSKWMKQLIDQVRVDLKQPDLPWFISEQHKNAPWRNVDPVNAALDEMARSDRHVTLIKTSHLPHARHHFGTKGTLLLGEEMANAYLTKP